MEIDAVLEVEAGDPQIAIDFLVANVNLSKSRLKDLMNKGGVWRVSKTGERARIRRAMTDILVGEQIEIFYDDAYLSLRPIGPELIEDLGQYSIWNKPSGLSLSGSDFGDYNSFQRALELHFQPTRDIYWLQAFDYEATGIMVVAHTRKAAADLTVQFNPDGYQNAMVHYRCDVQGDYNGGEELTTDIEGDSAHSRVNKVRFDARPDRSVLDLWPTTGRPYQVRQQCAQAGNPVVGDELFGRSNDDIEGLRMKIIEVSFVCPVDGKIQHVSLLK
ncbi:pseudouridine synthase [Reinekea sp. G2M2-21]|uniref:pseudouridine synthase n=1 Tax=Reinekea sp. G2M2-21 TaxID=2788942 RepID=UPI0018AC0BA6|nr:pseudouridine synthase [Reinekea sp. G2M2-21]